MCFTWIQMLAFVNISIFTLKIVNEISTRYLETDVRT